MFFVKSLPGLFLHYLLGKTCYPLILRLSINAATLWHFVSSGRDGERLVDVLGLVDFVGRFIFMRLINSRRL